MRNSKMSNPKASKGPAPGQPGDNKISAASVKVAAPAPKVAMGKGGLLSGLGGKCFSNNPG